MDPGKGPAGGEGSAKRVQSHVWSEVSKGRTIIVKKTVHALLSGFGAAALAASFSAYALTPAQADDQQITVAFVSGPLNDSFFPPLYQGANDAASVAESTAVT